MKKFFRWAGIVLGSLLVLILLAYVVAYFNVKSRLDKHYEVAVHPISIPSDSASIALGAHIAAIKGCGDCHGTDLGGKVVIDDPALGRMVAPNITTGKGGLIERHGTYTDEDYVRAIKHGLSKKNQSLLLMPSYEYAVLSQKDMGALVGYLKSLTPVDKEVPDISLGPVGYVLTSLDKLQLVTAEKVDHAALSPKEVHPEITADYGQYVAISCTGCHGANYTGGAPVIPGSPMVPNITAKGNVGKWTEAQFIKAMQTGVTPEGKRLDEKYMPWPMAKNFTETEIRSLYLFLNSLEKDK